MSKVLKEVRVADRYVQCMYPLVKRAQAASDCCRQHATTTVELPNGVHSYRCRQHRGLIKGNVRGPVSETTLVHVDVPDDTVDDQPEGMLEE